jgi:hypothetical protein
MHRYLAEFIQNDLQKKMVILGGPRQVGKTTLSLQLLGASNEQHPAYLNWDDVQTRHQLLEGKLPANQPLIVLDEVHKYKNWRNLIKGFYDTRKSSTAFLITGSARLDYYRKGGDSLMGRYFFYRLHPLSLYEINAEPTAQDLEDLLQFGGFPEMFLDKNSVDWKRWQKERITRVIRDDLVSLEQIKDVTQLEMLAGLLTQKVGSTLSVQSIATDLSVSHEAIKRWIAILENVYYCFRISPFGSAKIKALKKDQKLYLWDWSSVAQPAARLENLLACNLLKYCHFHEDTVGDQMELRYLRDKDGREVDFVVIKNGQPLFAVECKSQNTTVSKAISYYAARTDIPIFYQLHLQADDYEIAALRTRILPFTTFAKQVLQI